jgi:autotransporter-associated beta strand protein
LNKIIVLQDGATVAHENGRSLVSGAITLQGTNTFNVSSGGTNPGFLISGPFDGDGTLVKVGSGSLVLSSGSVNHTGPTRVNAGSLLVDGTIANSPITVSGGTLGGAGTVLSTVLISTNGRLSPGNLTSSNAVMIFEGELTMNGTTIMDVNKTSGAFSGDRLQGFGTLHYGGTLQLNLTGEPLVPGDEIVLFSFGSASGNFASIVPAVPAAGLVWDTSSLTVDGTLKVASPPRSDFSSVSVVGPDIVFGGGGGPASTQFRVLSSTNVVLPIVNWEPVATNSFDASGNFNFSLPIEHTTPQRFFILAY